LQRRPGFKVSGSKIALLPKRNFNTWMRTFDISAMNASITTETTSGICCDLGAFCIWFVGLWACRLCCSSGHAQKEFTRCASLPPDCTSDLGVGPQTTSLYMVQSCKIYAY
jgi:hypothetical protein